MITTSTLSPFGIGWFILYGHFGVPAAKFMPDLRALGARRTKIYLFWQQLEPEPGRYDWSAADAFVDQLESPDEGLISLFSSSMWATRTRSAMLPPSPALDLERYRRVVHAMVQRYRGRVRFWQNDCEPTNPVFWAGTAEEYVAQLRVFSSAVRDADADAVVVLGGHDGLFRPPELGPGRGFPGQEAGLAFFDHVVANARDTFDLFDLRLYADPYTIVPRVEHMRRRLATLGATQPLVCTEYGGPGLFEFAENHVHVPLMSTWSAATTTTTDASGAPMSDTTSAQRVAALYDEMATLPPQTQMFMQGCAPELEAKLRRLQSRDLVQRNLLALSAGVRWTMYWELVAAPGRRDDLMDLMFGKVGLLGPCDDGLCVVSPVAEVFARMARTLGDVRSVERIEVAERPEVFLFRVERSDVAPMYVAWERRDPFTGEDAPATERRIPWDAEVQIPRLAALARDDNTARTLRAIDVFGARIDARVDEGMLRLPLSVTPVYIEAHD